MTLALDLTAPLPAHWLLVFLVQVTVLLLGARVLGGLAVRLGLPALAGELLAGVLLGPSVLAHVAPGVWGWLFPAEGGQVHLLDAVGQFGVLLLVGLAGMHVDVGRLRRLAGPAAKISLAGLLIPLALGVGIGAIAPPPMRPEGTSPAIFAMFVGVAICVTAVPVIAKVLMELGLTDRRIGQLVLSAAVIDDVIAWFLLSLVSALVTVGALGVSDVLEPVGCLAGVVLFAATIGRMLVRRAVRHAEASRDSTAMVSTTVILVLGGAAATHAMGLEPILGAFVAGVLIGSGGVRAPVLAPLHAVVMSVLAPLFFATAGLRMDLSGLLRPGVLLATTGLLVVAVAGKFAGAFVGGRLSGLDRAECIALGAGMNARGVVEVIIATVGLSLGVLGTEAYTALVLVAVVTSVMAPPILRRAVGRSDRAAAEEPGARPAESRSGAGTVSLEEPR
ncbi:Na(+)/H(+)-K(+) antiporter GerN [Rhodococcus ruber]|uniref:cation:proton antiporter n=1 Tax=Rhodococcus ruber TaxID=1830 RepID=UPI00315CEC63